MNNVMVDLDFLIDLFDDFNAEEIGEVIKLVLSRIEYEMDFEEVSVGPEDFNNRALRTLARGLINEYKRIKRKQDAKIAKIR